MSVNEFLDSLPSAGTRRIYRMGLKRFFEWYGKTADEVLNERKDDLTQRPNEDLVTYRNRASRYAKIIEQFHSSLLEQKFKINTAKSLTNGIRQLFRYYQMDVKIRVGSGVNRTVKTQRNFPLTIEHVRKLYAVADFRERVILSMATDLGLRLGDFLEIQKQNLPDLTQEAPIAFDVMTRKEDVVAKGFLSSETVDLLKKYVESLRENNPYLFPSSQTKPRAFSSGHMQRILNDLTAKAGLKVNNGKALTFHCFRKMFLSASINSGVGLTAGKIMVGKTVNSSDSTYLTTVKLREKFVQLKTLLTINQKPIVEPEKLESLKKAVSQLQEDLTTQKTISETVSGENKKIKKELALLKTQVAKLTKMFEDSIEVFQGTPTIEQVDEIEEKMYELAERKHGVKRPRDGKRYLWDNKKRKWLTVEEYEEDAPAKAEARTER